MTIKNRKSNLSIAEFSELLLKLYRLSSEAPPKKFQQSVFDCMRKALSFDSAIWGSGLMASDGAIVHTVYTYCKPMELMEHYAQIKHLDVLAFDAFYALGQTINFASTDPTWLARCDPKFLNFTERFSRAHALVTGISDRPTSLLFAVWLDRADLKFPFTEEERLFPQSLMPHLAETWRLNWLNFLEEDAVPEEPRRAIAICDQKGLLYEAGARFSALICMEWPDWMGKRLPDLLLDYIANEQWCWQEGKTITIKCEPINDMRLITIRKKRTVDILSRREIEIAKYFGHGTGYREIAESLFIAPKTVRNHIQTIYEKLDISSRIELALLLSDSED